MNLPPVKYDVVMMRGGVDQITPTLSLAPGVLRDGLNFECATTGGYTRIVGYERYDGQPSPSDATYQGLMVVGNTMPALGSTVTGQTSTATGTLIAQGDNFFILSEVTGSYLFGENLRVGGSVVGVAGDLYAAPTIQKDAEYNAAAADARRALIAKVPGSGPIRGVFVLQDVVYAFRDNALATGCDLYQATGSGWTQVNYRYEISFTAGSTEPADGATLTQGGVTATIKRVCTQSGAWAGTAAGRFVITAPSGGNFAAGAATATGGCTVTLSGVQTAITMQPGGKFETYPGNFLGRAGSQRVYGCDGVNRGFEFDGETLVPITTGTTPDAPNHVAILKNHLFWAIKSSLVHSGINAPYTYTSLAGAGEIAVGEDLNVLLVQPGAQQQGTMALFTDGNIFMLYGTSSADWNLVPYNTGTGARKYSGQNAQQSFVFDDRGVVTLQASLNYGNFDQSTLTVGLRPFIVDKRTRVSCACLNREKSQYRVFFNDGFGLYLTVVNGQYLGGIPVYYPIKDGALNGVNVCWEGELTTGEEVTFVGGVDGYVYELDKGTSFDGAPINAHITLNFAASGNSRILKRYRKASLEVQGTTYSGFDFGYQVGYGADKYDVIQNRTYYSDFSTSKWDAGYTWDSGVYWDGRTLIPSEIQMVGTGENVSATIACNNSYSGSFTVNSLILHYTPRRGLR